MMDRGTVRNA